MTRTPTLRTGRGVRLFFASQFEPTSFVADSHLLAVSCSRRTPRPALHEGGDGRGPVRVQPRVWCVTPIHPLLFLLPSRPTDIAFFSLPFQFGVGDGTEPEISTDRTWIRSGRRCPTALTRPKPSSSDTTGRSERRQAFTDVPNFFPSSLSLSLGPFLA